MKKNIAYIIIIIIFTVNVFAQNIIKSDTTKPTLRVIKQNAFTLGEKLTYDVVYSFIKAGEAIFSIPKVDTIHGRPCYQILFTVTSTPTFSLFYKVNDRYEVMLDKYGIFPWRFSQQIREGKFSRDYAAEFDQINHIATTKKGQFQIPPYVYDAVSAMYYIRTMNFSKAKPGDRITLKNFYKDSTYQFSVKFLGYEEVEVEAGTFNCLIIEPLLKEGGLFKNEGRIVIWLTNDEKKIPVKVSSKVIIGSIDAVLREYSGLANQIKAKVE